MEREANYFIVGIFVSLTLLALVGASIWLAGEHDFSRQERYTVYFTDSVSGLDKDGVVKYKGVQVGKILALRLSPKQSGLIKADIEVGADTPVNAGTTASIEMQGITGESYIDLATATNDSKPPPHMPGEQYPVLKGSGSQLSKFLDDMPRISQQFQTTLSSVDDLSREGAKMADSIRDLAEKLKEDPSQLLKSPPDKGVKIPK